ncbi:hypothetical protein MTF64_16885 [Pseudoalteromonas sp. 2CM41L]|uniref:hypothetical protein n=1 Tax=Pseudoalteromonas sp. 2CM41L TaxID=2929857 RepID=UPI0020C0FA06|nr:hypothetical protein [Pseudoalteromonas sp. 2CM41L]MCK8108560.1 hypothetical protein [Pseudoalteromonas sp. 2CM41L]
MNYQTMLNSFAIFHEVGHAILAINLGIKINYVSILNGNGHIAVDTKDLEKASLKNKICFFIAGDAAFEFWMNIDPETPHAAEVYLQKKKTHACDDYKEISEIFDNEGGIFNLPLIGPWVRKRYLSQSFKYSYKTIESQRSVCILLAKELCQRQKLTYEDILRLI